MPTIDADAHVIESERTWEYIDADQSRPSLIIPTGGKRQYWLIDGRVSSLPSEDVDLRGAAGRVLAADVTAGVSVVII